MKARSTKCEVQSSSRNRRRRRWLGSVVAWAALAWVTAARALDTNRIPDLRPPLGEVPPTWWEQHIWQVVGTALVVFVVLMGLVRLFVRPRLAVPPNLQAQALAELRRLAAAPDDAGAAAEAGRQLRKFLQASLALPSGELTSDELVRALARRKELPAALRERIGPLLRDCDARHFAAVAPTSGTHIATHALQLAGEIESWQRRAVESATVKAATPG